ncbi:MAG: hypothetical protein Q9160_005062 [Pyrenula sp. 1 TL-2023]
MVVMAPCINIQDLTIAAFYTCYAFVLLRCLQAAYRRFFRQQNRPKLIGWPFKKRSWKYSSLMNDEEASRDKLPGTPLEAENLSSPPLLVKHEEASRLTGETLWTKPTLLPFAEKQALNDGNHYDLQSPPPYRLNPSFESPIATSHSAPKLPSAISGKFYPALLVIFPLHMALCVFSLLPTTLLTWLSWDFVGLVGLSAIYKYDAYVSYPRIRMQSYLSSCVALTLIVGYWMYFFLGLAKFEKLPDGSGLKLEYPCWGLVSTFCGRDFPSRESSLECPSSDFGWLRVDCHW